MILCYTLGILHLLYKNTFLGSGVVSWVIDFIFILIIQDILEETHYSAF